MPNSKKNKNDNDGKMWMSVEDAGRKGGERTSQTHGREFYQEIGQKGGAKGGRATSNKYGPRFYSEIGRKGGERVRELIEEGKEAEQQ